MSTSDAMVAALADHDRLPVGRGRLHLLEVPLDVEEGEAVVPRVSPGRRGAGELAYVTYTSAAPDAGRVVVVTDEQSHDGIAAAWAPHSYLINVAPYKPGLDVSQGWTRINGWSDRVVDWMLMEEADSGLDLAINLR